MSHTFKISGQLINIKQRSIEPSTIEVTDGIITAITPNEDADKQYILPGFIDAHIHIESSMLIPSEFARLAVLHGTVATVSDPHEIGNVLGVDGVNFMIENGKKVPFKFYFGAPSCVPATVFETAGATINAKDIEQLLARPEIKYLAEMMNWPGVLYNNTEVYDKIAAAKKAGKPVDGHAPGLRGQMAGSYVKAGISTDHECFTEEEALDKLGFGMKIIIREGSAAKNFKALIPLMDDYHEHLMFCSDDKHPDELVLGHINQLVARAVAGGYDLFHVLQAACLNPIEHYKLDVGQLRVGDAADFISTDDLKSFKITATYINGQKVAEKGYSPIASVAEESPNNFFAYPVTAEDFHIKDKGKPVKVIVPADGELMTGKIMATLNTSNGFVESDLPQDILKMAVVNRYKKADPAVAFIKNIGLKRGAIASSVGHDSHNIVVVGVDDTSIAKAVNLLMDAKGGVVAVDGKKNALLPLPVAGLMSTKPGIEVAEAYSHIDQMAKDMGSTLQAPFMTLSFMALLVIPSLKLSDLGLFDGNDFQFVSLHGEG